MPGLRQSSGRQTGHLVNQKGQSDRQKGTTEHVKGTQKPMSEMVPI